MQHWQARLLGICCCAVALPLCSSIGGRRFAHRDGCISTLRLSRPCPTLINWLALSGLCLGCYPACASRTRLSLTARLVVTISREVQEVAALKLHLRWHPNIAGLLGTHGVHEPSAVPDSGIGSYLEASGGALKLGRHPALLRSPALEAGCQLPGAEAQEGPACCFCWALGALHGMKQMVAALETNPKGPPNATPPSASCWRYSHTARSA